MGALVTLIGLAQFTIAATSVNLGAADNFAVLAGSTITNTGSSVINGDIGLSPGTSITGFPPGTLNGVQHVANGSASNAQTALVTAYNNAVGQSPVNTIPTELGGSTKTPGIYNSTSGTFGLTGTLTLDAQGDANAVFIFKTASTLTTAGSSNIVLTNGAQSCNVFWQVGTSATLGINSTFKGSILAMTSVTLTTGANVTGRVLAQSGAVTLDSSTVTKETCAVASASVAVAVPVATTTLTTTPVITPPPTQATAVIIATTTMSTTTSFVPSLPNTGIAPTTTTNTLWNVLGLGVILAAAMYFFFSRKNKVV